MRTACAIDMHIHRSEEKTNLVCGSHGRKRIRQLDRRRRRRKICQTFVSQIDWIIFCVFFHSWFPHSMYFKVILSTLSHDEFQRNTRIIYQANVIPNRTIYLKESKEGRGHAMEIESNRAAKCVYVSSTTWNYSGWWLLTLVYLFSASITFFRFMALPSVLSLFRLCFFSLSLTFTTQFSQMYC